MSVNAQSSNILGNTVTVKKCLKLLPGATICGLVNANQINGITVVGSPVNGQVLTYENNILVYETPSSGGGSTGTALSWTESISDPIYNPYVTCDEDYFPCVLYNAASFNGNGDAYQYKMWHQANTGQIGLSLSNDGINWILKGVTNLPMSSYHITVLYDVNNFNGIYPYKCWFWTGTPTLDQTACQYAYSTDGYNWVNIGTIAQNPAAKLVDGISPGWFYHFYGPGCVIYNPTATSIIGQPLSYPYAMYYDISTEGSGPGSSAEAIGLAYSIDGITWSRYGQTPVLIPVGSGAAPPATSGSYIWDASHVFRATVTRDDSNIWHMYFTGSNQNFLNGIPYAHGIGHAVSRDGVTWAVDWSNPVFYYNNGQLWRSGRTYAPCVLFNPLDMLKKWKMWFSGGIGDTAGILQGIGYATM
jgi:hypothetical protein